LHACALAQELGIGSVIVPAAPGLFSAFGLIVAPLQITLVRALRRYADALGDTELSTLFDELRAQAQGELIAQHAEEKNALFAYVHAETFDMRYRGQSFELNVAAKPTVGQTLASFHARHTATYGYSVPEERVEFVNARLTTSVATGPQDYRFDLQDMAKPSKRRRLWFDGQWLDVPVTGRQALREGDRLVGAAIIEEYDATTFVPAGWRATVRKTELHLKLS